MNEFKNLAGLNAWLKLKKMLPAIRAQRQQFWNLCRLYEELELDIEQDNFRKGLADIKAIMQALKTLITEVHDMNEKWRAEKWQEEVQTKARPTCISD